MTSLKRRYRQNVGNSRRKTALSSSQRPHQKQRTLTLFDQIPVPIARVDIYGFILEHNNLFSLLFGLPSNNVMKNVLFSDLVATDSQKRVDEVLEQTKNGSPNRTTILGHCIDLEPVWLKRGDGSIFPARVSIKSFIDGEAKSIGRAVVIIDETPNYDAIRRMKQEKEDLKNKDQFKNEFVTIASHELRTPIQPILGFALLATQGLMPQDQAWEGVLTEARRLQQLANDILDVSRIDSGQLSYEFKNIRINEVLVNTIESLKTDMKKNISIVISIQEGTEGIEIEADKSRMAQVITNVVGNAIKFTEKGVIRIETRAFKDQNRFELRVSDTGRGISDDIFPRLFEKFMTKNHGDATTQGTGLGLYLTKSIVTAHLGDIVASNNSDAGATFVIELPISRPREKTARN